MMKHFFYESSDVKQKWLISVLTYFTTLLLIVKFAVNENQWWKKIGRQLFSQSMQGTLVYWNPSEIHAKSKCIPKKFIVKSKSQKQLLMRLKLIAKETEAKP